MMSTANRNCYITGGSGYLGQELVRDMIKRRYNKVYVPIRGKKGESGQERFNAIYNEEERDCCSWVDL